MAYEIDKQCVVTDKVPGSLKDLKVLTLDCQDLKLNLDIVKEIDIFNVNDKVRLIISREKPEYTSNDFCAHGYIFYEKRQDNDSKYVSLISLYGLIVKIISDEGLIKKGTLNMMDHVYLCLRRS